MYNFYDILSFFSYNNSFNTIEILLILCIFSIILFTVCIYFFIKTIQLQKTINKQNLDTGSKKLEGFLEHINHLNNVISGINHEIQPLVGIINNKLALIERKTNYLLETIQSQHNVQISEEDFQFCLKKIYESQSVIETLLTTLKNISKDIKTIQEYNLVCSNLGHSIVSWVYVVLNDLELKNFVKHKNVIVDEESLNFCCWHSPMFVSQIVLNLIKNSIEHNLDKEDLLIKIYGDRQTTSLIYIDNGKGIPKHLLQKIFTPGFTTKYNSQTICGLGLSLCKDYCESMKALIRAEECDYGAKFIITFQPCVPTQHCEKNIHCKYSQHHHKKDQTTNFYRIKKPPSSRNGLPKR